VRRVGLGKGQNLFRVDFDILSYFRKARGGTLALQSLMASLLAPESKCFLTARMTKKYWHK
jgi:hypothetical protein